MKNITNFEAVSDLNTLWGNLKGDPNNPAWNKLTSQAKNILDEYNELLEALANKDVNEVRDAICDILVFTYGLGHMVGAPVDEDMEEVADSNYSKFCEDKNDLDLTIAFYAQLGVEVKGEGEFPRCRVRSTKEQTDRHGKIYQANKILKSISWEEPSFRNILG